MMEFLKVNLTVGWLSVGDYFNGQHHTYLDALFKHIIFSVIIVMVMKHISHVKKKKSIPRQSAL